LSNSGALELYDLIEKQLLDDLCSFLQPFQEVIVALSEDQKPTIHLVIPLRQYLINMCKIEENDSIAIAQIKQFLGEKKIKLFTFLSLSTKSTWVLFCFLFHRYLLLLLKL
jgi:hypothetical protein